MEKRQTLAVLRSPVFSLFHKRDERLARGIYSKKVPGMDRAVSCGEERSPLPEAESSSLLRLPKDCQLLLGECVQ